MHISLVTLFPEFFASPLDCGLLKKAQESGLVQFSFHNPRDFATDNHKTVDDRPYGGTPGMVMKPEILATTLESIGHTTTKAHGRLIYLTPKGKPLTQELARSLSQEENITLISGRYEGIDARVEQLYPIETISVGDFVLNGGEAAALCLIEAACRLLPGFMGHHLSGEDESFSQGLLEHPHYTRPESFAGHVVPEILRSGDHAAIADYRRKESLKVTLENRRDLFDTALLTPEDRQFLLSLEIPRPAKNLYLALVHHPVFDKQKKSIAVSLTNLDVHDIGRSSCTYGLGGCYMVTPIEDQLSLLDEILSHWVKGSGALSNPDRQSALSRVHGVPSISAVVEDITSKTGQKPLIAGTTAIVRKSSKASRKLAPETTFVQLREALSEQPVLLLFGTGHGLATEALTCCDIFLPPIRWHGAYNHLSVRSAVAIILDRLLGDWY